jgi:hypothetical protein
MVAPVVARTSSSTTAPAARARSSSRPPIAAFLALITLVFSLSAGCAGGCLLPSALRWKLFSLFGAPKICPEMLKRSVAIRLQNGAPAMGRFFPMTCSYSVDDDKETVTVAVGGTGYGYLMPAKRIGFSLNAAVEYRADFTLAGDDIYLWGRLNRVVDGPRFQLASVENPVIDLAANLPPVGSFANFMGNQVVAGVMAQGFTVIHSDRGDDFTLGQIYPPARPKHPFQLTSANDRYVFANETVDVQGNQRDYLGPFEVTSQGQSIYFTASVVGSPVDVMVVNKLTGDMWRDLYQRGTVGAPPGPVLAGAPLNPGPAANYRWTLPPGLYYVVIDNTAAAGLVSPNVGTSIWSPITGGGGAQVSYVAQLGQ